jgi:hypothetical protein
MRQAQKSDLSISHILYNSSKHCTQSTGMNSGSVTAIDDNVIKSAFSHFLILQSQVVFGRSL